MPGPEEGPSCPCLLKKACPLYSTSGELSRRPEEFRRRANANDPGIYDRALRDPEAFWAEEAKKLDWFTPWQKVLEWNAPWAKWFVGGKLNVAYNCVDRHAHSARRNKAAIIWEGEPGDSRVLTYGMLEREVNRFANALRSLGVAKGDRVAIYMGMVPELAIAMLACAKIGAPHSIVFGGFSAEALRERINDAKAKVAITCDGAWRRGSVVPLKASVDEALRGTPTIQNVVVVRRVGDAAKATMQPGRDVWWHEIVDAASDQCAAEPMDAEDMLFVLYTSGTTGKPKGIVHTSGGYLVGVSTTHRYVFDIKEEDVYWCTADIGWVTGHSYIVYGPLANGATSVMYEGTPDYPDRDRFWSIIDKYGVNIFYTAPTAIRTFMRWGTELPARHSLASSAADRHRRRADQSRGVDLVQRLHRPPALPDRGYVVADRNGHDPDFAAAGLDGDEAGLGDASSSRHCRRSRRRQGRPRGTRGGRLSRAQTPLAGHDAHDLRRSRSLRAAILVALSGHVFHGRRLQSGRRRIFLASGPRGRRHERGRTPHLDLRSRKRACGSSFGRRSGGDWEHARSQRAGNFGVRHA